MDDLALRAEQRRAARLARRHRIDRWHRRCAEQAGAIGVSLSDYLSGDLAIRAIEAADPFDFIGGSQYA